MLTSDPRIVPSTKPVNELTFEEATELAYFGAQVRGLVGCVCVGKGGQAEGAGRAGVASPYPAGEARYTRR